MTLTGHFLLQKSWSAAIFCAIGLMNRGFVVRVLAALLSGVKRGRGGRLYCRTGVDCRRALALGRCDIWEVSVSCGYAITMLALAGIWKSLYHPNTELVAGGCEFGFRIGGGGEGVLAVRGDDSSVPVVSSWRADANFGSRRWRRLFR